MIWASTRRWRLRRRALALLATASLVLSSCLLQSPPSARQEQWRLPPQGEVLAAATAPRQAAAVQQRLQVSFTPLLVASSTSALRNAPRLVPGPREHDGSLPPARQRYRRVVHDDRSSDLPA